MDRTNGVLEDISAEIGYTATTRLVVWFCGEWLFVPQSPAPDHIIARVIGDRPFVRLCQAYGGQRLFIPFEEHIETVKTEKRVATMVRNGMGTRDIAQALTFSERYVQQIRRRLEDNGVLPLVLKGEADTNAIGGAE